MKYKDDNERLALIQTLKEGKATAFWKLMVETIKESIKDIQAKQDSQDLQDLDPASYKVANQIFVIKKQLLETLINSPDNMASWLEKPESAEENMDPYSKAEDLRS